LQPDAQWRTGQSAQELFDVMFEVAKTFFDDASHGKSVALMTHCVNASAGNICGQMTTYAPQGKGQRVHTIKITGKAGLKGYGNAMARLDRNGVGPKPSRVHDLRDSCLLYGCARLPSHEPRIARMMASA
jgi:hypothetical protein